MHKSAISPLDDYPVHQIPQPLRYVATSDRNFYDRYYFSAHDKKGGVMFTAGIGIYPNLGVMDGFAAVRRGDDYQVVRVSKALGIAREDMTIGPLSLVIEEPLKRMRLMLAETEHPLSFDMEWSALVEPHEEPSRFRRDKNGRITHDHFRFGQTGQVNGWLTLDGTRYDVTSEGWTTFRDRSWGVRPVGEAEPEKATERDPAGVPADSHFWNYVSMVFPDQSIFYVVEENKTGFRSMESAWRFPHDGGSPVALGRPEHNMRFVPGSRVLAGATITMQEPDGTPIVFEVEPLLQMWIFLGTGYRQVDHWRHGKYQGELAVEGLRYSFRNEEHLRLMRGTSDVAARFTMNGDVVGHGLFEYSLAGANDKYGFKAGGDIEPLPPA